MNNNSRDIVSQDCSKSSSSATISEPHAFQLPMLSSTCPGWVCYAEKSHPEVLPLISTAKSAQQIIGTVFKQLVAPLNRIISGTAGSSSSSSSSVYHVTVMPCFDKKLEASRKVI